MNIFKRKKKVRSSELAQWLFSEFVSNPQETPPNFTIDDNKVSPYQEKMLLYRFALALLVVGHEEQKNAKYKEVRQGLQSFMFPPSPTDEALALAVQVENAMRDLDSLVTHADRPTIAELIAQQRDQNRRGVNQAPEFSFAWAWLHDIGIDETDPVDLSLFAFWWMDFYIMLTKLIREFNPVADPPLNQLQ